MDQKLGFWGEWRRRKGEHGVEPTAWWVGGKVAKRGFFWGGGSRGECQRRRWLGDGKGCEGVGLEGTGSDGVSLEGGRDSESLGLGEWRRRHGLGLAWAWGRGCGGGGWGWGWGRVAAETETGLRLSRESQECSYCLKADETGIYALRDCVFARQINVALNQHSFACNLCGLLEIGAQCLVTCWAPKDAKDPFDTST
ncbi:hypothetical protein Salat_2342000 [Sesamum alatum]|uniref:Uncharacterized protein n=1 Tax=Sesamum alatum TaxID=300844 RepID=A0AAE1XWG4_9LAMI|nr:hypothetical protein Salat_2342000 [Sesamum alatum]